ncbi:MAG: ATP-binding protein [Myxococcota bacterium]
MTGYEALALLVMGGQLMTVLTVAAFAQARQRRALFLFAATAGMGAFYALAVLLNGPAPIPARYAHLPAHLGYVSACGCVGLLVRFLDSYSDAEPPDWVRTIGLQAPVLGVAAALVPGLMFVPGEARPFVTLGATFHAPIARVPAYLIGALLGFALLALLRLAYGLRARFAGRLALAGSVALLLLLGSADMAVSVGLLDVPYTGHLAGVAINLVIAWHLAVEWGQEGRQLSALRRALEEGLGERSRELAAAQEALAHRDRLAIMGRVAATVGHEINNPLTYVLGNLDVVAEQLPEPSEERTLVLEAREGAGHIARIVRDLRWLSQRKQAETLTPVDVASAVDAAKRTLKGRLSEERRIVNEVTPGLEVSAESTGLAQVFLNLFTNALEALGESAGTVRVSAEAARDQVEIEVRDDGPGLPEAMRDRLFEPFASASAMGLGLGLTIVKNLVESYGGRVEAESRAGEGTLFRLRFARHAGSAAPSRPVPRAETLAGRRVFVVDDQPEVARALTRLLRPAEVESVVSGFAALERLGEASFDVVLCDVMMPGISGLDVWERLRADARPTPPFVFMTGGAPSAELQRALEATGVPVLYKPFPKDELVRLLEDAGVA